MGTGASKATHDARGRSKEAQPIQREDTMRTMFKKAKKSESDADTLFERIDQNGDGEISMIEVYYAIEKHGKAIQADWPTDRIKQVISKYDADGNGYINREEFSTVLKQLGSESKKRGSVVRQKTVIGIEHRLASEASQKAETKAAHSPEAKRETSKKADPKSPTDKKGAKKEGDTPKKRRGSRDVPPKEESAPPAAPAAAPAEEAAAAADDEPPPWADASAFVEKSITQAASEHADGAAKAEYFAAQEAKKWWVVPLERDLSKMPWLARGETCMRSAVVHARSVGRTPLLVDTTEARKVDQAYAKAGAQARPRCLGGREGRGRRGASQLRRAARAESPVWWLRRCSTRRRWRPTTCRARRARTS